MSELIVVMAYHDREKQLLKTLESLPKDIEVVIVNDSKPLNIPAYDFDIDEVLVEDKHWINPGVNFNIGFAHALKKNPKYVIIQNPECYHAGDVVAYVRSHLTEKNYLSFACYSLGKGQGVDFKDFDNRTALDNGDSAWYNHSKYRPEALHFCCAITAENLRKINGFDENFANGLGYEDNYLVHQIKTLGLKIEIIDNPYVLHQYHYDNKAFNFDAELYARTGALCERMRLRNTYKAEHFITEDL